MIDKEKLLVALSNKLVAASMQMTKEIEASREYIEASARVAAYTEMIDMLDSETVQAVKGNRQVIPEVNMDLEDFSQSVAKVVAQVIDKEMTAIEETKNKAMAVAIENKDYETVFKLFFD